MGGNGIQELYHGQQDIPDEHRIFTKPGEICKPPMKLEDVNIADTIMKLHAVSISIKDGLSPADYARAKKSLADYEFWLNGGTLPK